MDVNHDIYIEAPAMFDILEGIEYYLQDRYNETPDVEYSMSTIKQPAFGRQSAVLTLSGQLTAVAECISDITTNITSYYDYIENTKHI